jgi:hypothetical protein
MVGHIRSGPAFLGLGIGLDVLTVTALFTLFKKRGLVLVLVQKSDAELVPGQ